MSSETSEVFLGETVKCVIFFAVFLLALTLSARKSEIRKTLMMSIGTFGQIKKCSMLEIIFSKNEFQI